MGRHNRHDQHRGAVAGNSANAVLVHDQRFTPVQVFAHINHGLGEEENFLAIQFIAVAGNDKGGEFNLGVAVLCNVLHDGREVFRAKSLTVELAVQGANGCGRLGLCHRR